MLYKFFWMIVFLGVSYASELPLKKRKLDDHIEYVPVLQETKKALQAIQEDNINQFYQNIQNILDLNELKFLQTSLVHMQRYSTTFDLSQPYKHSQDFLRLNQNLIYINMNIFLQERITYVITQEPKKFALALQKNFQERTCL